MSAPSTPPSAASVFAALPVPALLLCGDVVLDVNAKFLRMMRVEDATRFVDKPLTEHCLCEPDELRAALAEALAAGSTRIVMRRPDDSRIVVEADAGMADDSTLLIVRDASEGTRFQQVVARLSSLHIAATRASFGGVRSLLAESEPVFHALGWSTALFEIVEEEANLRDYYLDALPRFGADDIFEAALKGWSRPAPLHVLPDLHEVVSSCEGKLREHFPAYIAELLEQNGADSEFAQVQRDLFARFGLDRCAYAPVFVDGDVRYVLAVAGSELSARDYAAVQLLAAMLSAAEQIQRLSDQHAEERRLRALGQMAAQLAHEVRNPIAVILTAFGQIKRTTKVDERGTRLFSMVEEEIARLDRLVGDLVYFAGPLRMRGTRLSIPEVVDEVVQTTLREAERDNVAVTIEELAPVCVRADATLFREMFRRLLQSVYKPGVRVVVSARLEGEKVVVRVADDGPPLDLDVAERVFEPFFATRANGAGLALAVVRRLAEDQGGAVDLVPRYPHVAFELRFAVMSDDEQSGPVRLPRLR